MNDLIDSRLTNAPTVAEKSGRYTVGPTVQLGLPLRFRLEVDALYRPMSIQSQTLAGFVLGASPVTTNGSQWRIPVLLQYRLTSPLLKPFVEAGYLYDHAGINPLTSPSGISISSLSRNGFILGAGLDFKVPFLLRVSPELRYTHEPGAGTGSLLTNNQAEVLIGIRF